jgi:outer membrane protein TolC
MRVLFLILFLALLNAPLTAETRLNLEDAITMAIEHSFEVKASDQSRQAAIAENLSARAERYPSLSADLTTYYLSETTEADLPFGQTLTFGTKDNYQIDLKLALPLFTGGRIGQAIRLSENMAAVKAGEHELSRLSAAFNCRRAYLALMLSHAVKAATDASLERVVIIRQDASNLHAAGLADSLDIFEAELAYQKTRSQAAEQEKSVNQTSIALATLLGVSLTDKIVPAEKIDPPFDLQSFPELKIEDINRPELDISREGILAAKNKIRLQRTGYFPNLGAYLGYSGGRPNRDFISAEYNDFFVIGANLNWAFNLGRKTGHLVKSADFARASAEMNDHALKERLLLSAELARENLQHAYTNWEIVKRQYAIAREKFRLAKIKHEEGGLSINRLLELETELTAGAEMYEASLINYYIKETEWFYALGSEKIYGGL